MYLKFYIEVINSSSNIGFRLNFNKLSYTHNFSGMSNQIVINIPGNNVQQQQPMGQGYYQPGYQQQQPMMGQPMMMQPMNQQPMMGQPMHQQQMMQPMHQQQMIVQPVIMQQPVIQQQQNNNNKPGPKKGYERLAERGGVYIKQRFDWEEAISGCETENVYYVYPLSKDGDKKGNVLFKCKEKSSCCARMCLSGECRPFQVSINTMDKNFEELDNEPFLRIDRTCKCTCYCFNRPEINVYYVEKGTEEKIGKITDPFNCCDLVLEVFDRAGQLRYKVDGSCCQLGIWCKFPCEPCQQIDFSIKAPSGDVLSEIKKTSPGCLKAAISDADNFALNFPAEATKEDKALLLAAVIFLDFRHFEENPQQHKGNSPIIIANDE